MVARVTRRLCSKPSAVAGSCACMALLHNSSTVQITGIIGLGSFMFLAVIIIGEQFHLSGQLVQYVAFTLSVVRVQNFGFFLILAFRDLRSFRLAGRF